MSFNNRRLSKTSSWVHDVSCINICILLYYKVNMERRLHNNTMILDYGTDFAP